MMNQLLAAFRIVYSLIEDSSVAWALTGSLAFRLRGIEVPVKDIDLQTDADGAYEIERRLKKYVVEPVQFRSSPKIRSHFGKLLVDGVSVEMMGDIEKLTPDGSWLPTPPLHTITERIHYDGLSIPVLRADYEYHAYKLLGRDQKAELLLQWIAQHRD
jgi:hypothetical protein